MALYAIYGIESVTNQSTYPLNAAAAGMAFLCMGGRYWGRHFLHGLAFYALAIAMLFSMRWVTLEYAVLWTIVLVDIVLHLRRRAVTTTPSWQSSRVAAGT